MELFRLRCQSQPWGLAVNICSPLAVKWTLHGMSPRRKPIRGAVPLAASLWFLHKLLDNQRGSVTSWDEIRILKHERTISESRVPADSVITGAGRGEGGVWGATELNHGNQRLTAGADRGHRPAALIWQSLRLFLAVRTFTTCIPGPRFIPFVSLSTVHSAGVSAN